jgi:superfamily II DNA or RNA helicase
MILRAYQSECVQFLTDRPRGFVIAPAGSGKTVVGAAACHRVLRSGDRVAWLANTREQVEQADTALKRVGVNDALVACIAAQPDLTTYDIVVIDEAHHAPAATWHATIGTATKARHLWGLSATPWSDDKARNTSVQQTFLEFIEIDRADVMAGGHLVPGIVKVIDIDQPRAYDDELSEQVSREVARRTRVFRNLPEHEHRRRVIWQYTQEHLRENPARNAEIVYIAKQEVQRGQTVIVLVGSINHGEILADEIGPSAACIHSKLPTKYRRELIENLKDGTLRCAVATSLLDEGADFPRASVLILAAGGRSSTKTIQRAGRVMRPYEGKTCGIVYDFADRGLSFAHAQWKARFRVYEELGYEIFDVYDPAPDE